MISHAQATRAGLSLVVSVIVGAVCVYGYVEAQSFQQVSSWFPTFVSIVGAACAVLIAARETRTLVLYRRHPLPAEDAARAGDEEAAHDDEPFDLALMRSFLYWMGWLVLLAAVMIVVGGEWAASIWLLFALRFGSKTSWRFAIAGAVVTGVILYVLVVYTGFYVPFGRLGIYSY